MHSELKCISRSPLFVNLPQRVKERLLTISSHREFYPRGALIQQPLADADGMVIIDEGSAKVYNVAEDGREKIIYILNSGDIEGQQLLFKHIKNYNFIQSLEDSWVCSIKYTDFQGLLQHSPDLSLSILNNFGNQLIEIERNNVRRDLLDVKSRIMAYFGDLQQLLGKTEFILPIKKKELASMLGITPETLSRQLHVLIQEKRIKVTGRKIRLL